MGRGGAIGFEFAKPVVVDGLGLWPGWLVGRCGAIGFVFAKPVPAAGLGLWLVRLVGRGGAVGFVFANLGPVAGLDWCSGFQRSGGTGNTMAVAKMPWAQ